MAKKVVEMSRRVSVSDSSVFFKILVRVGIKSRRTRKRALEGMRGIGVEARSSDSAAPLGGELWPAKRSAAMVRVLTEAGAIPGMTVPWRDEGLEVGVAGEGSDFPAVPEDFPAEIPVEPP